MRARAPEPRAFISPKTADDWLVGDGEWVDVANEIGAVRLQVKVHKSMPDDLLRVPHGWWKPKMEKGLG